MKPETELLRAVLALLVILILLVAGSSIVMFDAMDDIRDTIVAVEIDMDEPPDPPVRKGLR